MSLKPKVEVYHSPSHQAPSHQASSSIQPSNIQSIQPSHQQQSASEKYEDSAYPEETATKKNKFLKSHNASVATESRERDSDNRTYPGASDRHNGSHPEDEWHDSPRDYGMQNGSRDPRAGGSVQYNGTNFTDFRNLNLGNNSNTSKSYAGKSDWRGGGHSQREAPPPPGSHHMALTDMEMIDAEIANVRSPSHEAMDVDPPPEPKPKSKFIKKRNSFKDKRSDRKDIIVVRNQGGADTPSSGESHVSTPRPRIDVPQREPGHNTRDSKVSTHIVSFTAAGQTQRRGDEEVRQGKQYHSPQVDRRSKGVGL